MTDQTLITLALEAFKSTGFLVVNKRLLKSLGLNKAVLLSAYIDKCIYFRERYPENNGSFYTTHKELSEQLGMSEYTIRKCKSELVEMELIRTKMRGVPAKEWIEIDVKKLIEHLGLDLTNSKGLDSKNSKGLNPSNSTGLYNETKTRETSNKKETKKKKKKDMLRFGEFLKMFPQEWVDDKSFQDVLRDFYIHRKSIKSPVTKLSAKRLSNKLIKNCKNIKHVIETLSRTIENGWTGVFPESIGNNGSRNSKPINTCGSRAYQDDVDVSEFKYQKGEVVDVTEIIRMRK